MITGGGSILTGWLLEVEAARFDVEASLEVDADAGPVDRLLMSGFISTNSGLRCRDSLLNRA